MARRVKKTDTREVDHWVSTDDGRHLPIDKDGNIIFGSSKKSTSKSGSNKTKSKSSSSDKPKKKAIDEDKMYEIADRYNSSEPVSGDWNTELDHEIATIQKEFGLSKSEAKDAMKKYLGFTDDDFADDEPAKAPTKKLTREQEVLNDDKVQNLLNTAKSSWGEGVFKDSDGEEFEIGYETDKYYNIYQTSDGQRFDESRVQRMVEGQDSGKYRAWNNQGQLLVTSSARAAVKHAWGTPKEAGLKREAPKESDTKKPTASNGTKNYSKLPEDIPNTLSRTDLKEIKSLYRKDKSTPSYIAQSPTSGARMEKYIDDVKKDGADVKKLRQEFSSFKADYLAAANLVNSKEAKDYITRKAKEYQKRFDDATSAKKPTRKPASSKTNKIRQLMGNDKSMVEWKINRAFDKTSLKELALDAGVPSSKVRTMSTEELRAMLLSMWKGK